MPRVGPVLAPAEAGPRGLMTLGETLVSVWQQALVDESATVTLDSGPYRVTRTRSRGLKVVEFEFDGRQLTGIEQNPETASKWAALARQGQRVMQFNAGGRYFANVVEGKLTRYSAWAGLELAD
jgi:hypothetical protein